MSRERELLDHLISCIVTVKQENTRDWMDYICEEINKINEDLGDPDRAVVYMDQIRICRPRVTGGNR